MDGWKNKCDSHVHRSGGHLLEERTSLNLLQSSTKSVLIISMVCHTGQGIGYERNETV